MDRFDEAYGVERAREGDDRLLRDMGIRGGQGRPASGIARSAKVTFWLIVLCVVIVML